VFHHHECLLPNVSRVSCTSITLQFYLQKVEHKYFLEYDDNGCKTSGLFICIKDGYACSVLCALNNTGRFVMFSVITNIYNKKTKGSFWGGGATTDVRCVHHG